MPSIHRILSWLPGALCLVAVTAAHGAEALQPFPAVVPEPPVPPAAVNTTPPAAEPRPLAEYELPLPADPATAPRHGAGNGPRAGYAEQTDKHAPPGQYAPADQYAPPGQTGQAEQNEQAEQQNEQSAQHAPMDGYSYARRAPWLRFKAFMQRTHWGYAEHFLIPPAGSQVCAHRNIQIANAMAAQMALYRYDFHDGIRGNAIELNEHGLERLEQMTAILRCRMCPIMVEPTPEQPALAAARRNHVLSALDKLGMPVSEVWVVVAKSPAAGLSGEEAIGVHEKMMRPSSIGSQETQSYGMRLNVREQGDSGEER